MEFLFAPRSLLRYCPTLVFWSLVRGLLIAMALNAPCNRNGQSVW